MSRFNVYSFRSYNGEFSPYPIVCPSDHDLFIALAKSYQRDFCHRDKLRSEPLYKIAEFDNKEGIFFTFNDPIVVVTSDQFKHLFSLNSLSDGLDLLLSEFGALNYEEEGAAVGDTSPEVAERKQTSEDVSADELKDWE